MVLLIFILDIASCDQLTEGLKSCLAQNKQIYQAIYDIREEQKEFYKVTRGQLNELSEKVDQLMIPENSYWKVFIFVIQFCMIFIILIILQFTALLEFSVKSM